ncbi:unnamed protein product [Pleuronectes platessa]|uniref:Uncharacterized protein n=1 Tax=Pleuronectes platessa TaxID=8262 RepID=A0A9N7V6U2_PLEPL|nr:unnamed protein product [Pleuronectes platessa]
MLTCTGLLSHYSATSDSRIVYCGHTPSTTTTPTTVSPVVPGASCWDQPQVDITFGPPSYEDQPQVDITLGPPSYEDQPQVDITLGAPSFQMIETTEDEAPAASEEAVRKEQVQPEESVSCVTENVQAFMTDLSHEELDGEESLQEMVELIFKRAVQKPHSAAVFAELCQHLSTVSDAS